MPTHTADFELEDFEEEDFSRVVGETQLVVTEDVGISEDVILKTETVVVPPQPAPTIPIGGGRARRLKKQLQKVRKRFQGRIARVRLPSRRRSYPQTVEQKQPEQMPLLRPQISELDLRRRSIVSVYCTCVYSIAKPTPPSPPSTLITHTEAESILNRLRKIGDEQFGLRRLLQQQQMDEDGKPRTNRNKRQIMREPQKPLLQPKPQETTPIIKTILTKTVTFLYDIKVIQHLVASTNLVYNRRQLAARETPLIQYDTAAALYKCSQTTTITYNIRKPISPNHAFHLATLKSIKDTLEVMDTMEELIA